MFLEPAFLRFDSPQDRPVPMSGGNDAPVSAAPGAPSPDPASPDFVGPPAPPVASSGNVVGSTGPYAPSQEAPAPAPHPGEDPGNPPVSAVPPFAPILPGDLAPHTGEGEAVAPRDGGILGSVKEAITGIFRGRIEDSRIFDENAEPGKLEPGEMGPPLPPHLANASRSEWSWIGEAREKARADAKRSQNEERALEKAEIAARRAFAGGAALAAAAGEAEAAIKSIFDNDYDDGSSNMDIWNNAVGAAIGETVTKVEDIPALIESTKQSGGFIYEDDLTRQPKSAGGMIPDPPGLIVPPSLGGKPVYLGPDRHIGAIEDIFMNP
ncbi:MAG: hypothetical protein C0608_10925 [Deltaproteobacteria bacterium]|nr:MAG: hypothetical protein C0608_10925 [Deltaproteobacteria bacterium]